MLLLKDEDVQKVLTMPMTLEALDATQKEIFEGNGLATEVERLLPPAKK